MKTSSGRNIDRTRLLKTNEMKAAQKTMNSIRILAVILTGFWAVALAQEAAHVPPPSVAEPKRQPPATPQCDVDLRDTDTMSSIISNVLIRAEHKPEREVSAFLNDAASRTATGDDLLKVAAAHYKMDQKKLATSVEHWRHINCEHAAIPGFAVPDSQAGGRVWGHSYLFVSHPPRQSHSHGDPLMDLSRLDRQLFGDCGDGLFAFEVPANDGSLQLSRKFST